MSKHYLDDNSFNGLSEIVVLNKDHFTTISKAIAMMQKLLFYA